MRRILRLNLDEASHSQICDSPAAKKINLLNAILNGAALIERLGQRVRGLRLRQQGMEFNFHPTFKLPVQLLDRAAHLFELL